MLDFSESERYLPQWDIKRELVFEHLEEEGILELKRLRQHLHAAATARGDSEGYKHHFDHSLAEVKGIGELLFPWIDWETDPKGEQYKKIWEDWFGIEVGSPEWQELERQGEMLQELYQKDRSRNRKVVT